MLHEVTRLQIFINRIEDTIIKYHNSTITICSDRGLHLIDYSYNLQCYDKNLDYIETSISAPKYSPVSELFEGSFVKNGVRNSEFIQLILDPTLWPHNNQLLNEMTSIVAFAWSPVDFVGNMDSVIAVLTNVGCVEVFGPKRLKWTSVLNLSSLIKENFNQLSLTEVLSETPKNYKQLQKAAHTLATTAICWPDKINEDGSCYFVTVQKSGNILFWLLESENLDVKAQLVGHLDAGPTEILLVNWVPVNIERFFLITSNVLGRVECHICIVEEKAVKCLNKKVIWTNNDRMLAKHLNYVCNDEDIILTYTKHRHFVVQVIDKECTLKSQEVVNINDFKIMDLKRQNNNLYLGTVNNKLYKVEIQYNDKELKIQTSLVEIKDSFSTSELHGIAFSHNGALCMLALVDRKVLWRKEALKIDLIFLKNSMNSYDYEMSALLSNPAKKLTNQWDYIEMLRYKIMKAKMLPDLDYNQLLVEGDNDIYKLKLYYLILVFYNNLENLCKNTSKCILPEASFEVISEKIHASYACNLIKEIHQKSLIPDKVLTMLESETLVNAKSFLWYYCMKYKKELQSLLDPKILEKIGTLKYICQCCDEVIEGFTCKNGHLNVFCSLTFTPIEGDDYLVCKACGALACSELLPYKPTCVFCDLHLSRYVTA